MANPKILLLGRYGHPHDRGGVATATRSIVNHSIGEGLDFHIVSIRSKSAIDDDLLETANYGSDQIRLDIVPSPSGFVSRKHERFEEATDSLADIVVDSLDEVPDLIHVFSSYPNYVAVAREVSKRIGKPYIVSTRGTDVYGHNPEYNYEQDIGWYMRPLEDAKLITVLSDFILQGIKQNLISVGYSIEMRKVHNGVEPDLFTPLEKVGIPKGSLRIVYAGRIRRFKGLMDIARAVHQARQTGVDVELDIYGPSEEGKDNGAYREIDSYIRDNGLSEFVRCDGKYVPNESLPHVYRRHNLFITASRCEGLPNAIMEAMSCGLAVSCNYPSGSSEISLSPEMVFETGNIEQMVRTLQYLAENPDRLTEFGSINREFAIEHHWKNIALRYVDIYRSIMNTRN